MTRVLWFHPRPWGTARHGGDIRTRGLVLSALARGHEVALVVPMGGPDDEHEGLTLLTFAEPAGVPRSLAAKLFSPDPLRSPRLRRGGRDDLRARIRAFAPSVAVVSEVMSWSIAHHLLPPGLPVVYDAQNLEGQRFRVMARGASGVGDRVTLSIDARRVSRAERDLLDRSRVLLAVSDPDAAGLRALGARGECTVVPSSVTTPDRVADPEHSEPRVLFVGSLDYPPNQQAVEELATRIWPLVLRSRADAHLDIVGRNPGRRVRDLAGGSDSISLHADVDSVEGFYLVARAVVAPLRSGGGTKLKVYEALSYGLPLVATPEALHGVRVDKDAVALADRPEEVSSALVRLLDDAAAAGRLGRRARAVFLEELSWSRAAGPVLDRVLREVGGQARA
ncbi:glycosyltransferase family 4 protein [Oryzobacter telluris]|uniref:glycosyltransferase family 4 protein n=1 Tax=Oryzobacter telluris TaxID=3149179 RepID=UPI00370DA4A8